MKKIKQLIMVILLMASLTMGLGMTPSLAMEDAVKKAYMDKVAAVYEDIYGENKSGDVTLLDYQFYDLDGDGVEELIINAGFGYLTEDIYTYRDGAVVESLITSHSTVTACYPKIGVVKEYGGHMGEVWTRFYKFKSDGTCELKAEKLKTFIAETGKAKVVYTVNGKKCKKKKYNKYVSVIKSSSAEKIPDTWEQYGE